MFVKILSILFCIFLYSCSNLLYFSSNIVYDKPQRHGLEIENLTFTTSDNVKLHSWLITSPLVKVKKGLILQYHGNAENLSSHYISYAWLAKFGYDVLIFDYRGFGQSEGEASPYGLYLDAQSALDFALSYREKNHYEKFIVSGQSLGGAVLLKTLSEAKNFNKNINLVILESTFRSNSAVSASVLRRSWLTALFSPLAYILMNDSYNASIADLVHWPFVTLCVTHKDDPVVASYLLEDIFKQLKNAKKKWLWLRDDEFVGHLTSFYTPDGPLNLRLLDLIKNEI